MECCRLESFDVCVNKLPLLCKRFCSDKRPRISTHGGSRTSASDFWLQNFSEASQQPHPKHYLAMTGNSRTQAHETRAPQRPNIRRSWQKLPQSEVSQLKASSSQYPSSDQESKALQRRGRHGHAARAQPRDLKPEELLFAVCLRLARVEDLGCI